MTPTVLTNQRSERVKAVAALGRRAVRQRTDRVRIEGPHAVRELLACASASAIDIYLAADDADSYADIAAAASEAAVPVYVCGEFAFAAMSDAQHPQGVLAVARPLDVPLTKALAEVGDGFVAVLSNVRDPGNAGTVIRAADAFGAAAVIVSDSSVDVYNPKVIRSTVGSLFHLPLSLGAPIEQIVSACQGAGLKVLAADGASSLLLPDAPVQAPHAWVFGNESWGLSPKVREMCDEVVAVPIPGKAESLNLAMAATVCLHTSAASRHAHPASS
ncbi:MAG: RNA methyltransferase [Ornithinimicrobium sp.]